MNIDKICSLSETLKNQVNTPPHPICQRIRIFINECLEHIITGIDKEYPLLFEQISKAKSKLYYNNGNSIFINPVAVGRLLAVLDVLYEICTKNIDDIWGYIHPEIIKSSKQLYLDGYHTDAAFRAFVTINEILKDVYRNICPNDDNIPDGTDLMNKMFSNKRPLMIYKGYDKDTNKNLKNGMRPMLEGAMTALRNPPAHSNHIEISKEEAMRRLMFASMLMYKIDEAVPICDKTN